jgi:hypothetical protein
MVDELRRVKENSTVFDLGNSVCLGLTTLCTVGGSPPP